MSCLEQIEFEIVCNGMTYGEIQIVRAIALCFDELIRVLKEDRPSTNVLSIDEEDLSTLVVESKDVS